VTYKLSHVCLSDYVSRICREIFKLITSEQDKSYVVVVVVVVVVVLVVGPISTAAMRA
jgi:hypothetical protein